MDYDLTALNYLNNDTNQPNWKDLSLKINKSNYTHNNLDDNDNNKDKNETDSNISLYKSKIAELEDQLRQEKLNLSKSNFSADASSVEAFTPYDTPRGEYKDNAEALFKLQDENNTLLYL